MTVCATSQIQWAKRSRAPSVRTGPGSRRRTLSPCRGQGSPRTLRDTEHSRLPRWDHCFHMQSLVAGLLGAPK